MTKRYYDPNNNALVYSHKAATPQFWDGHWKTENFVGIVKRKNRFLNKITGKYLAPGSRILEGGCGWGGNVYSLQQAGFDVYGIDFAPRTVALINKHVPELKVSEGDVRRLPFDDGFFDAYWSLGVIEHFYDEYEDIVREMTRVIRPGGFLFLTFPHMHPLRKFKVRQGIYSLLPQNFDPERDDFYQFALDAERTVAYFKTYGFELKHRERMDGVKGFKDEVPFLKPVLQKLYDSRAFVLRAGNQVLDMILKRWCGHSMLLVLRKD